MATTCDVEMWKKRFILNTVNSWVISNICYQAPRLKTFDERYRLRPQAPVEPGISFVYVR
jgi:hypothetical protein